MSAKPPILPSVVPPKIAGVASKPPTPAVTPAVKEDPYPFGHKCVVDDRSSDPSQYYPFHVDCQCGFHASCTSAGNELGGAQRAISVHWMNIKGIKL